MTGNSFRSPDEYSDIIEILYGVTGSILFAFAKRDCERRDVIIRNFIARSTMSLKAIYALWSTKNYQDAWSIHRGLLDRLFHLHYLGENDQFEAFDDWSFYRQFSALNRVKSDKEFKNQATGWDYELSIEQKERIRRLEEDPPRWNRPKAEEVAKDMDLVFLYKYGYDYGSMHVHPMSDDGQQDFFTITRLEPAPRFPDQITLLHNSVLVGTLILQEAMNRSSFRWRALIYNLVDEIRTFIGTGDTSFKESFVKFAHLAESGEELCG